MDRGFNAMIPQAPATKKPKEDFKYDISLPLFGRVLSLTIKINSRSES